MPTPTITKTKLSAKTKTVIALLAIGVFAAGFAGYKFYKNYQEKQKKLFAVKRDYAKQVGYKTLGVSTYKNNKVLDADVLVDADFYSKAALPETKINEVFDKINNDFLIPKSNQKMVLRNISYLPRSKKPFPSFVWKSLTDSYPGFYFSQDSFKDKDVPEVIITFSKWSSGWNGVIEEIENSWFPVDYISYPAKDYITNEIKDEAYKSKLSNFCNEFPPFGSKISKPEKAIVFVTYPWDASFDKFKVMPDSEYYYKDKISFTAAMITRGLIREMVAGGYGDYQSCMGTGKGSQQYADVCPKEFEDFKNGWKQCS